MNDKSYVTIEKEVCVVCGQPYDTGALLLDTRGRNRFDPVTVTRWGMCPEHQEKKEQGYIALVGADPSKSKTTGTGVLPADAYRTGELAHVRESIWEKLFNIPIPPQGVAFVDPQVIEMLKEVMPAVEE